MSGSHTHGNCDTEQTDNYPVHFRIDIFVLGVRTVHDPVCILAHAETKKVGLGDDEVEILVVYLCDVICRPGGCCLGGKVFEKRAGDRTEEVYVCGSVEAARQVGGDGFQIRLRRLDQINDGRVRN